MCNACLVPAEETEGLLLGWPEDEYDTLLKDSTAELVKLKSSIEKSRNKSRFQPAVSFLIQSGLLTDVVNQIVTNKKIDLVIIGTHGGSGLTTLLLGNHSKRLIDGINSPLLLVPPDAKLTPVKKIAFATDFKNPAEDIKSIAVLTALAIPLDAEILLTHINGGEDKPPEFEKRVKQFVLDLPAKINFSNIKYTSYNSNGAQSGLEWLCGTGDIDNNAAGRITMAW